MSWKAASRRCIVLQAAINVRLWALTSEVLGSREFYGRQQLQVTLVWTVYAAVLLVLGVRNNSSLLRWQGLVLLGIAIFKVFLFDLSELALGFRILSFMALGVVLLGVSFLTGGSSSAARKISHERRHAARRSHVGFRGAPALSEQWVHFKAWRAIDTSPAAQPGLVRFELPVAMYGSTQPDLEDIPVIDDMEKEVPFVIDSAPPRPLEVWNEVTLSDAGFVPGQYTQVVADVGATRVLHNTLRLMVPESESDFFEWVAVDASDDRNTWRVVRERAPIFRLRGCT